MRATAVLLVLLLSLLLSAFAHAEVGMEIPSYSTGECQTPASVVSYVEARIENRGFYRVFVALPQGWQIDMSEYRVYSYPVREHGLWRIYGEGRDAILKEREIYTLEGKWPKPPVTVTVKGTKRTGWYLKPNEGLRIEFLKLNLPGGSGNVFNPLKVEERYEGIVVTRWYQEFEFAPPTLGWVCSPWSVKGATLVEAYPAPYSEKGKAITWDKSYFAEGPKGARLVYEPDVPDWDEWLPLSSSLAYSLVSIPIMDMPAGEYTEVEEPNIWLVWDTQKYRTDIIRYAFEWKRGEEVEGITLTRDDTKSIPSWTELF